MSNNFVLRKILGKGLKEEVAKEVADEKREEELAKEVADDDREETTYHACPGCSDKFRKIVTLAEHTRIAHKGVVFRKEQMPDRIVACKKCALYYTREGIRSHEAKCGSVKAWSEATMKKKGAQGGNRATQERQDLASELMTKKTPMWMKVPADVQEFFKERAIPVLRKVSQAISEENKEEINKAIEEFTEFPRRMMRKERTRGKKRGINSEEGLESYYSEDRCLQNIKTNYHQIGEEELRPHIDTVVNAKGRPDKPKEISKAEKVIQLATEGKFGKASKVAIGREEKVATKEIREHFEALGQERRSNEVPPPMPHIIDIDEEKMEKVIARQAQKEESTGISGWSAHMIHTLWKDNEGKGHLKVLIKAIINNKIGGAARDLILMKRRVLIPKKQVGKFRAIDVGESLLKVATKYASQSIDMEEICPNGIQMAMKKGGLEIAAQGMQALIDATDGECITMQIDIQDAYPSINQEELLKKVMEDEEMSKIGNLCAFIYQGGSPIFNNQNGEVFKAMMNQGLAQGCVLSTLCYCFMIDHIYGEATDSLRNATTSQAAVYATTDDLYLGGSDTPMIMEAAEKYIKQCRGKGLKTNQEKLKVHYMSDNKEGRAKAREALKELGNKLFGEVILLQEELACNVAGSIVGNEEEHMKEEVRAKVQEASKLLHFLAKPEIPIQIFLRMTPMCVLTKLHHLCRTMEPALIRPILQAFDFMVGATLRDKLSVDTMKPSLQATECAKKQISLPFKLGGLGFRPLTRTSTSAFLGSAAYSLREISIIGELADEKTMMDFSILKGVIQCYSELKEGGLIGFEVEEHQQLPKPDDFVAYAVNNQRTGIQGIVTKAIEEEEVKKLIQMLGELPGGVREQARFMAARSGKSHSYLCWNEGVTPMDNQAMKNAVTNKIGLGINADYIKEAGTCLCRANALGERPSLIENPYHLEGCLFALGPGRVRRHNMMVNELRKILVQVGVVYYEQLIGDGKKADLILMIGGKVYILDVVVSSPMQNTFLPVAKKTPLIAATRAAKRKNDKYSGVTDNNPTFTSMPISFETLRGASEVTRQFFTTIGAHLKKRFKSEVQDHVIGKMILDRLQIIMLTEHSKAMNGAVLALKHHKEIMRKRGGK